MTRKNMKLFGAILAATALMLPFASSAVELDTKAVIYALPDQIKWGPVTPARQSAGRAVRRPD